MGSLPPQAPASLPLLHLLQSERSGGCWLVGSDVPQGWFYTQGCEQPAWILVSPSLSGAQQSLFEALTFPPPAPQFPANKNGISKYLKFWHCSWPRTWPSSPAPSWRGQIHPSLFEQGTKYLLVQHFALPVSTWRLFPDFTNLGDINGLLMSSPLLLHGWFLQLSSCSVA